MAGTHGISAGSDKLKSINKIHEFPLWKCYIQVVLQKKQYLHFFGRARGISRLN